MAYIWGTMQSLFDADGQTEALGPGAVLLPGRALQLAPVLLAEIEQIAARAPFRRMTTPGGFEMSVAMTNCGRAGWLTDRSGYRYATTDPQTGAAWPAMPAAFAALARKAAAEAGYDGFVPDACLINRYEPGARLSLHQDRDEADQGHPIVSVSLGLPPQAKRSVAARCALAWRRRRLGRAFAPLPSRRAGVEKRRASADRRPPLQSHAETGALTRALTPA